MKQFIGNPTEKLRNLMDPSRPLMSGVVQNQDSYMKGKIAQRYFYDRVKPALQKAMAEYYRADRAALRPDRVLSHGRRRICHRLHGQHGRDRGRDLRLSARGDRAEGGRRACHRLPAFPRPGTGQSAGRCHRVRRDRAHGQPHGPEQSPDDRDQGGLRRRADRRAGLSPRPSYADHLQRLGGPGQPRRAPGRFHRRRQEHGRGRAALLCAGHQARAGAGQHLRPRCAPAQMPSPCAAIRSAAMAR